MGRGWFESSTVAAEVFRTAERVLGSRLGAALTELCFNGPGETLNRTDVAQPAIFTVSVACFRALEGGTPGGSPGGTPEGGSGGGPGKVAALAGLSLGEYTALHLAGAIEFDEALELVALRGRAMQEAAEASKGSMLALIGADEKQAEEVCAAVSSVGTEVLVCANFNAPGQIVLSGHVGACDRAVPVAEKMGLKATRLQVAGAFHSPLMQPAAEQLKRALSTTRIAETKVPVVSNVTARPHEGGVEALRDRLVQQLTMPVRWAQSGSWLVSAYPPSSHEYHELAPGKVLSGLKRRIDRSVRVVNHDEPAGAPA